MQPQQPRGNGPRAPHHGCHRTAAPSGARALPKTAEPWSGSRCPHPGAADLTSAADSVLRPGGLMPTVPQPTPTPQPLPKVA